METHWHLLSPRLRSIRLEIFLDKELTHENWTIYELLQLSRYPTINNLLRHDQEHTTQPIYDLDHSDFEPEWI